MTGGVTFCQLGPFKPLPFEVVYLLGLDDGTFPRESRPLGFDKSLVILPLVDINQSLNRLDFGMAIVPPALGQLSGLVKPLLGLFDRFTGRFRPSVPSVHQVRVC